VIYGGRTSKINFCLSSFDELGLESAKNLIELGLKTFLNLKASSVLKYPPFTFVLTPLIPIIPPNPPQVV
jgi:hypothetical protein